MDVGSIEFLHKRIVAERDDGTPVMIVSTELDEVLELADRIAVLYQGRLIGIVPGGHLPRRAGPDDGRASNRRGRASTAGAGRTHRQTDLEGGDGMSADEPGSSPEAAANRR